MGGGHYMDCLHNAPRYQCFLITSLSHYQCFLDILPTLYYYQCFIITSASNATVGALHSLYVYAFTVCKEY